MPDLCHIPKNPHAKTLSQRHGRTICLAVFFGATGSVSMAETIVVPSGQYIEFKQVIWSEGVGDPSAIFRFVAPEITRDETGISYEVASNDIFFLCKNFALPRVLEVEKNEDVSLVISLSEQDLEFGESDPDVTQFFESFVVHEEQCAWGEI